MSNAILNELKALRLAVTRLEAERECAALLARYGYYCDHGRHHDWVKLFTEDAVMDLMMYYGENIVSADPDQLRQTRFVGHKQLLELISGPVPTSLVGRSQHQMGGPPATFRLIDENNALMVTYSVVYAKDMSDPKPIVQYQNHAMNRWTFRRIDGRWYIAENIRRRMGGQDSSALFEDF
jgi:hypothetical protein